MARFEFYDSLESAKDEELRLRYRLAGNRMMLALYRFDALLRKNFNPNQPRVPAGSGDTSGEWSRVGSGTTKPQPIQFVPSGQGSESDSSDTYSPISRTPRPKTIAASPDPLTSRKGNGRAAQISSTVNDVASGRSASVRKTIGSGLESTEVRIERKPDSRVTIDISRSVGRLEATGTMSSEPGKVTISNFKLTLPGMFNPLSIISAPTEVTLFDSPGGDLVYEIDKPLTIRAPLVGTIVDVPPGRYIMPDD